MAAEPAQPEPAAESTPEASSNVVTAVEVEETAVVSIPPSSIDTPQLETAAPAMPAPAPASEIAEAVESTGATGDQGLFTGEAKSTIDAEAAHSEDADAAALAPEQPQDQRSLRELFWGED
jgi:hypothetical protein